MTDNELQVIRHRFFFETPLYTAFVEEGVDIDYILDGEVDAYNPEQKIETTYVISSNKVDDFDVWEKYQKIKLTCKRTDTVLFFFTYNDGEAILKIGQHPSLADIQLANIGKSYDKLLSAEELKNFKKAIIAAAHGFGAGSLVYLRRIFENLVLTCFRENSKKFEMEEKEFKKMRMEDKIEELKNFLPKQLLEMKGAYKVLSKGVHELTEDECSKYFPALKLSIELVLDEKIEAQQKEKKDKKVKNALQEITTELETPVGKK
jgi:hypothetical protein